MNSLSVGIILACSLLASPAVMAGDISLKAEKIWIAAVPETSTATAAFMTLTNTGKTPLQIVGGKTAIAETVEPMSGTQTDGMAGMKSVPSIEVPPGGKVVLKPGGDHLMLMGLKAHPAAGDRIALVLQISPGGQKLPIEAVVAFEAPK